MNPTERAGAVSAACGPATAVLELAVSSRWRAPETTVALADQAAVQARAESDMVTALLAEGWLIHGLAAVGRGPTGVPRAAAAVADAARCGNVAAEARLRVGLASAARELGDQSSAQALLAPVVERDIADPELAADAHIEAVRCGWPSIGDSVLAAVDVAVSHIRRLRGEQVELGLAALDAALANRHRVGGRARAAVARAREGLRRLLGNAPGRELDPISPHIAALLTVELTLALFDDGEPDLARRVAQPALAWAERPALVPLTRLRLVLARRAYLPGGELDAALRAVGWAAEVVGEQELPQLDADCQSLLAEVHERRGALSEALVASRRAHQALRLHSSRVERALVLLGRCASGEVSPTARRCAEPGKPVDPRRSRFPAPEMPEQGTPVDPRRDRFPAPEVPEPGTPAEPGCDRRPPRVARLRSRPADPDSTTATLPLSATVPRPAIPGPDRPGVADVTRPAESLETGDTSRSRAADSWSGQADDAASTDGLGLAGWPDGPEPTAEPGALAPMDRPRPVGELAMSGDLDPARETSGDYEDDSTVSSETAHGDVGELFAPDEERPLGLVAIDVVAPSGRLTGLAARQLLARVAEHIRLRLPPDARSAALARDVVLVVLPPVAADVVSRWMRSMADGLSGRWSEYAAEVPGSAFRVAVGMLVAGRSPDDNVAAVCARLGGAPLQPSSDSTPSSGRHAAHGSSTGGTPGMVRATAEPGSGGRRRRPDKSGDLGRDNVGGDSIDRAALARLSRMAQRPLETGERPERTSEVGHLSLLSQADDVGVVAEDTAVPMGGPLDTDLTSGLAEVNGHVGQLRRDTVHTVQPEGADTELDKVNQVAPMPPPASGNDAAQRRWEAHPRQAHLGEAHPGEAHLGEAHLGEAHLGEAHPEAELSFAELLAGALAAYRDR